MTKVVGRDPAGQALVASDGAASVSTLSGFDPSRIVTAFERRLAIYRLKHKDADPFGADIYNRFEVTRYVIEAIEILAHEAGIFDAIATEAGTAETVQLGSVHEGAGPQDIAQGQVP